MKQVPYTNNSNRTVNICGKEIRPNETREVDARFVPAPVAINGALQVLYFNLEDGPRYFGDTEVLPGAAARLSANCFVDPNTAADKVQNQLFRAFLDQSLKALADADFSVFTEEELAQLVTLEQMDGQNARKGLLELVDTELNQRKEAREFTPEAYSASLKALDEEELSLELLQVADDEQKLPLVQDELAARKQEKAAQ